MIRHPKSNPNVRCCWICGKPGGAGSTWILQLLGFQITPGKEIGYAHSPCVARLRKKLA